MALPFKSKGNSATVMSAYDPKRGMLTGLPQQVPQCGDVRRRALPTRLDCIFRINLALSTLNQRVQGSSPCAPTNKINNLSANWRRPASQILALDNAWATSFLSTASVKGAQSL